MKDYIRLLTLSRRNWHYLAGGVACMAVSALFEGGQLGAIIPIMDRVFTNKPIAVPEHMPGFIVAWVKQLNALAPEKVLWGIIVFAPVFYLLKGGFGYLKGLFMNALAQRSVADVRADLFRHYQDLSHDFYSQKRQGELMSRITHDVPLIGHSLSYGITDVVYQSLLAVFFSAVAISIDWKMTLVMLVALPIIGVVISYVGKVVKKLSIHSQETMADLNSVIAEANQGVSIVKAFSREAHEIDRFNEANNRYYKVFMKGIKRSLILSPTTEIMQCLAFVFILWLGGRRVIDGQMSAGVFLLYMASLVSIFRPVKKLTEVYNIIQQGLASGKRIYDILDWKPSIVNRVGAGVCASPVRAIRFKDVSFRYEKDKPQQVIKNFSHDFEVGKLTALVGPTGCGKTTIMNMILRFYDPDQGAVLFDGQDIRDTTLDSLRSHIGLVTQEMVLFNESIRDNLLYGRLDASDDEILEAARQALALEFIERMPLGLDTIIGDRGMRLSGGQKQRLSIARAIMKNPRILLLDEATSALDPQSEHLVQQALDNLMKDRTVIVIAHRLSTIRHADCILVMENGRIIQKGVHDALLQTSELYAKLASYHFNQ